MKTTSTSFWRFSKSALLLITIMLASSWSMAQEVGVTDPSQTSRTYDADKLARHSQLRQSNSSDIDAAQAASLEKSGPAAAMTKATSACFIPLDASFTAIPRNDDGSFGPIALPFTFDLYGSSYTQVWINTNGNLTFTGPYATYSASGFPFSVPMVAPFWGDVDTRNTAGGQIHYKLSATNLIVTWDNVGYYNQQVDKLNEFQVVISDGVDPITGLGQNVCFNYGDMQWTTGSASSGVNGFGGTPATVGVNKGNSVDFYQLGRFNQNSSVYDGPGGNPDGINYLDQQCYCSQVSSAVNIAPIANNFPSGVINIDCGETYNLDFSFIPPEVNQTVSTVVNTGGACNTTASSTSGSISDVSFSITGSPCNEGTNVITFTATDNGTPVESTTVTLTVVVGTCCDLTASSTGQDESCAGQADGAIAVSTTGGTAPLSYSIDGGTTYSSSPNFAGLAVGTYTVLVQDANGCESVPETIVISGPTPLVATVDGGQTGPCLGQNTAVNGDFQSYTGSIQQGNNWINNNLDNWSVSHGTPSGFGNLRMWMWSYYGAGEGMYMNHNFVAGQEYQITYDIYQYTDANPTSQFFVRLNNNLTPSSGSTSMPSTAGTQVVSNLSWNFSGVTQTITETFVAGSNYSQLWFHPYLAGAPTPNQSAAWIDNVVIQEVTPCNGGGILCNGGTTDVTVSASGGTTPYSGTGNFTVGAGTHSFDVTDANGCVETVSITVTEPAQLVPSASSTSIDCNGGTATVTVSATGGTAPYSGTGNFTVGAGTYSYDVTDANGCTETVTITVSEPSQLNSSATSTAILCNGGTSTVTVTASGGTAPYSGTGDYIVSAGTHSYTVTDANGCTSDVTITVTEPTQLNSSATSTAILCNGGTSTVTVTASGGTAPYSGTGDYTVSAGTHSYTVTDANGCTSDVTITVTEPTQLNSSATSTAILCNGGTSTVTVSATGGTPSYSGTGNFTALAGTHTYTVTDANGCTSDVTITITEPTQLVASATSTVIPCFGGTSDVTVSATGGTPPYSGTGVNTVYAGSHTYTVTDANGCTADVTIVVDQPDQIEANITPQNHVIDCIPIPVTLTANPTGGTGGPYTYLWSTGETTASIDVNPNTTSTYTVEVWDANGCTVNASTNGTTVTVLNRCGNNNQKVVICHVPPGNTGNPQTICISPNALNPHLSTLWDLHGGDYCGPCQSSSALTLGNTNQGDNTFIRAGINMNDETIDLSYRIGYDSPVRLEIYDMAGVLVEVVHSSHASEGELYEFTLNTTKISSGVYIYQFITDTEKHIDKLQIIQ